MAIKNKDKTFSCSYCGRVFPNIQLADSCRESHDLVYIQISKGDLNRLIHFIYSKDESLLTASMINALKKKSIKGGSNALSNLFEGDE